MSSKRVTLRTLLWMLLKLRLIPMEVWQKAYGSIQHDKHFNCDLKGLFS